MVWIFLHLTLAKNWDVQTAWLPDLSVVQLHDTCFEPRHLKWRWIKGWADNGGSELFWTWDPWIDKPTSKPPDQCISAKWNCDQRKWFLLNLYKTVAFDKNRFFYKLYESSNDHSLLNYLTIKACVVGLPNF